MRNNLIVTFLVSVLMAGFVIVYLSLAPSGMALAGPTVPAVKGYADGQQILFIHTEASDPEIAKKLTDMMDSPVLVVPSLTQAPEAMLANVYVFTNGIAGTGPLGFQPDVFDSPPGTEGYSPLRRVNLVSWKKAEEAREMRSAAEIKEAAGKGEIAVEQPGVIVNMPMLTWPAGGR